jgi:hypothetical protein
MGTPRRRRTYRGRTSWSDTTSHPPHPHLPGWVGCRTAPDLPHQAGAVLRVSPVCPLVSRERDRRGGDKPRRWSVTTPQPRGPPRGQARSRTSMCATASAGDVPFDPIFRTSGRIAGRTLLTAASSHPPGVRGEVALVRGVRSHRAHQGYKPKGAGRSGTSRPAEGRPRVGGRTGREALPSRYAAAVHDQPCDSSSD